MQTKSEERMKQTKTTKAHVSPNTKSPFLKFEQDNLRTKQNYVFHMMAHKLTDKKFKQVMKGG